MGLIERSAPDQAKKAFLKLLRGPDGGGGPSVPVITLPVFVLGLRPLASATVASAAKQAGWQFLTIDSQGVITSGEVPASGAEPTEITRSQGPSWVKAYESYDKAKKIQQLVENDYEPWALRIPGLQIEAFWIRRKSANDSLEQLDTDLIVPFHSFSPKLSGQLVFTMRQFIAIAQPLARKQLAAPPPID